MPKPHERKRLASIARRADDRTEAAVDEDTPTPHRAKSTRQQAKYRLEWRMIPGKMKSHKDTAFWSTWSQWQTYHRHYATPEQRDEAMRTMNRKETLFEYRVKEDVDA